MVFFEIETLAGGAKPIRVRVSGPSVTRVTLSHAGEHPTKVTRVEMAGGVQLTATPMDDVAQAANANGATLIRLTVPDQSAKVWVSVGAFSILQAADSFVDPPGTNAVLRGAASLRQAVHESQQAVQDAIAAISARH